MSTSSQPSSKNTSKVETVSRTAPTAVTSALKGTAFPAKKADLIEQARRNASHDETVSLIGRLPDGEYEQMADVIHNLSNLR